jgi:hypothetical protein
VVAERGYDGTTIELVLRRATMSPTTFYANFAGKEECCLPRSRAQDCSCWRRSCRLSIAIRPGPEGRARSTKLASVAMEVVAGGVYQLAYRQVQKTGTQSLPELAPLCTYLTLAPLIAGS